jgi:hypothetical protein
MLVDGARDHPTASDRNETLTVELLEIFSAFHNLNEIKINEVQ